MRLILQLAVVAAALSSVPISAILDKQPLVVRNITDRDEISAESSLIHRLVMNDTQYHNNRKRMNASTKLDLNMTHSEASNTSLLSLFVPSTHLLAFMAGIRCLA